MLIFQQVNQKAKGGLVASMHGFVCGPTLRSPGYETFEMPNAQFPLMSQNDLKKEIDYLRQRLRELLENTVNPLSTSFKMPGTENFWQNMFATESLGMGCIDLEGRYLDFNDAWTRMLGYSRTELIGLQNLVTIHPDDVEKTRELLRKFSCGEIENLRAEKKFLKKNGETFWADLNFTALRDSNSKIVAIFWIAVDITPHRHAEEKLRLSEERLRSVVSNIPIILFSIDQNGIFTLSEGKGLEALGLKPGQVVGMSAFDLYAGNAEIVDSLNRALRGESLICTTYIQGQYFETRYEPLFRPDGALTGALGIATNVTEHKKHEFGLRESEHRLRSIIDSAPFGAHLYELRPDGALIFSGANRSADQILHINHQQYIGKPIEEIFPQLTETNVPAAYRLVASAGQNYDAEQITYQGHEIQGVFEVHAVQTGPQRLVAFFRDITERKKMEEEVKASWANLLSLIENTPDSIFSVDRDLRLITFNSPFAESFQSVFGHPLKAGLTPEELVPPREASLWRELYGAALRGERFVVPYQLSMRGEEHHFELSFNPIQSDGQISGVSVFARDITERRRAEAAAEETERRYREILENVNLMAVMLNFDGTISFCNRFLAKQTGWLTSELEGRNWFATLIPPEDKPRREEEFSRALNQSHMSPNAEGVILTRNGGRRTILWDHTLLKGPEGQVSGIASLGRDVTEMRTLEEQLRQSQKMESVGRLAGGIAHDFNNLLTAINGYSEILLMDLKGRDPGYQTAKEILTAGEKAAGLIRQLLAFSRKQMLQPRIFDLNQLIQEHTKMLFRLIGEDIELIAKLSPDLHQVKADPGQIEQVIINLAVNARDAMPVGGTLLIETNNVELDQEYARQHVSVIPGPYILLAVSDTGIGMDSGTLSHIFEPFFTTKEKGKGTGLGLSTVYGIVQQSGGHIGVYAEPGKGATFKIYLPAVLDESHPEISPRPIPESARGWETILVVEDERIVRNLACLSLQKKGYHVLQAANAEEALNLINQPDTTLHLLITDVVMPQISGRELAEKVRLLRPEVKILYMSGYTRNAIVHHGVLDPGLEFIPKPFSPSSLSRLVREILDSENRGFQT
jgi:two-component system cell cycle sensor histidine kinase/response regulator CckA